MPTTSAMAPAVGLTAFGGPEVLGLVELPIEEPVGAEVRVSVGAATVNPTDVLLRDGLLLPLAADGGPLVPGMDFAGVVSAVGDTATWAVGDEVMGVMFPSADPVRGAYAAELVVDGASLASLPVGTDFVHGSTVLMNGLTAMHALDGIQVPPGGTVGVTGGAGAVGGYTIELARARGLRVVADAAPEDVALLEQLGADLIVDRGADTGRRMADAAGGPLDAVVDAALIGADELGDAVRDGGWFVVVRPGLPEPRSAVRVHFAVCVEYFGDAARLDDLRRLVEVGSLTPRVARMFSTRAAADAHRLVERGGVRGRVVLTWDAPALDTVSSTRGPI